MLKLGNRRKKRNASSFSKLKRKPLQVSNDAKCAHSSPLDGPFQNSSTAEQKKEEIPNNTVTGFTHSTCMLSSTSDKSPAIPTHFWKNNVEIRTPEQASLLTEVSKLLYCEESDAAGTQKAVDKFYEAQSKASTPVAIPENVSKVVNTPPSARKLLMTSIEAGSPSISGIVKDIGSTEKDELKADSKLSKVLLNSSNELEESKITQASPTTSSSATNTSRHLLEKTTPESIKKNQSTPENDSKPKKNLASYLKKELGIKEDGKTKYIERLITEKKYSETQNEGKAISAKDNEITVTSVSASILETAPAEVSEGISKTGHFDITSEMHNSSAIAQISPAKEEELAEANRRMQEFLAKKQDGKVPKGTEDASSTVVEKDKKSGSTEDVIKQDVVEQEVVPLLAQPTIPDSKNFLAGSSAVISRAKEDEITVSDPTKLVTSVSASILETTPAKVSEDSEMHPIEDIAHSSAIAQISPAKEEELAEANRRMQEFLAKKQDGKVPKGTEDGPSTVVEKDKKCGLTEDILKQDLVQQEVKQIDVASIPLLAQPGSSAVISPAKDDEIAEANKRMMEFLAKQQAAKKKLEVTESPADAPVKEVSGSTATTDSAASKSPGASFHIRSLKIEKMIMNEKNTKVPRKQVYHAPTDPIRAAGVNIVRYGASSPSTTMTAISEDCEDSTDGKPLPRPKPSVSSLKTTDDPEVIEARRFIKSFLNNSNVQRPQFDQLKYRSILPTNSMEKIAEVCEEPNEAVGTKFVESKTEIVQINPLEIIESKQAPPPKNSNTFAVADSEKLSKSPVIFAPQIETADQKTPAKDSLSPPSKLNWSFKTVGVCPVKESELTEVSKKLAELVNKQQSESIPMKILSNVAKKYTQIASRIDSPVKMIKSKFGTPEKKDAFGSFSRAQLQKPGLQEATPTKEIEEKQVSEVRTSSGAVSTPTKFVRYIDSTPTSPVVVVGFPETYALSVEVLAAPVAAALIAYETEKKVETESFAHELTIVPPLDKKSCFPKAHMFDTVPEQFLHAFTPCTTPTKLIFHKRTRPPFPEFDRKDKIRNRSIDLVFPKPVKKSVRFPDDADLLSKELTFDEVVNKGGSGFRILSIHDHNTNTVRFPKYVPPLDFCNEQ